MAIISIKIIFSESLAIIGNTVFVSPIYFFRSTIYLLSSKSNINIFILSKNSINIYFFTPLFETTFHVHIQFLIYTFLHDSTLEPKQVSVW